MGRIDGAGRVSALGAAADIDLLLGMLGNAEAGAAQHRFDASAVRYPPIGPVAGEFLLDEMHSRKAAAVEQFGGPEVVVLSEWFDVHGTALHRLENEHVARRVVMNEVKSEQRMPQMV